MLVVLDTNVVVSRYLTPGGPPAEILDRWERDEFDLLVSEEILGEYERVLHYPRLSARHRLSPDEITQLIAGFRRFAAVVEVAVRVNAVEDDPDDDMFLACARAGGGEVVVSGDDHLLSLREYEGIQILSPVAFLAFLDTGR